MCFTYPYTYVPSCFTSPRANAIHFYSLYSLCLYTLRAFTRLITYTISFRKTIVIPLSFLFQYQCFFSWCLFCSHGISAYDFQCFHFFVVVKAQAYLGPKKMDILKISMIFFKGLSWTFTISTFYLETVLLNYIKPTVTHIPLLERKVKK